MEGFGLAALLGIKGFLEDVAQQREHPPEHPAVAQCRIAPMHRAAVRLALIAEGDRLVLVPAKAEEAIGLQPGQIAADGIGIGIGVTLAVACPVSTT